jgi:hypothetical protein
VSCCTNDIADLDSIATGETTASSWPLTLVQTDVYSFRIDAYDAKGTYVGTAFSDPPSYDDGFGIAGPDAFSYTGVWHTQTQAGAWGGTLEYSTSKGASATYISGDNRAFELIMPEGPTYGKASVSIDGTVTTLNLHAASTKQRQIVWVRNYPESLTTSSHTVRITNLGIKGHSRVAINAVGAIETD